MKVLLLVSFILSLTACGLGIEEETISSKTSPGDESQTPTVERAVFIEKITDNHKGTKVQCRLNDILDHIEDEIPVFIEFEGEEIERKVFKNKNAPMNFDFFNPDFDGELICVVEFVDALFESEPLVIEHVSASEVVATEDY